MMQNNDNSTLFVRPNLKLFFLAAMGLVVGQQLLSSGNPDLSIAVGNTPPPQKEVQKRLDRALQEPSVENYLILSESYRLRGENTKAMHFLRKARLAEDMEL